MRDCALLRAKILKPCTLQHLSSQACSFLFLPPTRPADVAVDGALGHVGPWPCHVCVGHTGVVSDRVGRQTFCPRRVGLVQFLGSKHRVGGDGVQSCLTLRKRCTERSSCCTARMRPMGVFLKLRNISGAIRAQAKGGSFRVSCQRS